MARQNFKAGTLEAPLPAVIVSVGDMEKSNLLTVAWTGILSSDPPRTYISVRPSRYSHAILTEKREFVINLTTEKLAYATDYVGIYTGAKVDKFEKCHLTKAESAVVAAPTVAESPIALECRVFDVIHSGTHDIFMADIVNVSCDDDILDERGWRELFASLEYLDKSHKNDFEAFSLSPATDGKIEVYLERALAYFIYRHCTEAEDIDDFMSSLGLCLVLERLLASLCAKNGARTVDDIILPARIISEELEYSEENAEEIKLEFAFR